MKTPCEGPLQNKENQCSSTQKRSSLPHISSLAPRKEGDAPNDWEHEHRWGAATSDVDAKARPKGICIFFRSGGIDRSSALCKSPFLLGESSSP